MCVYVRARARVCVCVCVRACVRACLSVSLSLRLSLASDSSETINVIIIKLGAITASVMTLHHMLIILTLTFIQGQNRFYVFVIVII